MKKSKKTLWVIGSILVIFLLTNPSNSDFEYYQNGKGFGSHANGGRTSNFLLFSIYEVDVYQRTARLTMGQEQPHDHLTFVGILKNFISI